ncbi:MAG: hypothetical protein QGF46_05695 [Planctomycetota bacterium]|jgi:hypothetical protein|nr:hypothetical protein [Planctomycetota bacterium]
MTFKAAEYDRYQGARSNSPAWVPLAELALVRGWRSKWVRRITALSIMQGFGLVVLMYALNQVVPSWRELTQQVGSMASPGEDAFVIDAGIYLNFLWLFVYPVLLPLSLLFGYDLISKDIETNAMDAYFSRPISPLSYILGRSIAFVGFLMAATFIPMLLVWISDWATSDDAHFELISHVPAGMFGALLLVSITLALLVQAITTITKSGVWTNISFVFIFIVLHMVSKILTGITDIHSFQALSVLHNTWVVCAAALDEPASNPHWPPAPLKLSLSILAATCVASFLVVYRGLKRRTFLG